MWFRTNDTEPVLSLSERYSAARALHGEAVAVFADAAAQLKEAATHFDAVAGEAQEEIVRLREVRDEALTAASHARSSTASVLTLIRGTTNE